MGNIFLFGAGLLLVSLILLLLGIFNKKINGKLKEVIEMIKAKLFWNAFIRYSLESYLKIGFVSIPVVVQLSSSSVL